MSVTEIQDKTPNKSTIRALERLLEEAKSGELRSIYYLCGWENDGVSHGWVRDRRNSRMRILGGMRMLDFEMATNEAMDDPDSVLRSNIETM